MGLKCAKCAAQFPGEQSQWVTLVVWDTNSVDSRNTDEDLHR